MSDEPWLFEGPLVTRELPETVTLTAKIKRPRFVLCDLVSGDEIMEIYPTSIRMSADGTEIILTLPETPGQEK